MTQLTQQKRQAVLSSLWELTFRTVLALLLPVALSAQTLDVTCLAKHNGEPVVVANRLRTQQHMTACSATMACHIAKKPRRTLRRGLTTLADELFMVPLQRTCDLSKLHS